MRIATFNLENLDDIPGAEPSLQERIPILRPQLERLNADILCLQEVHGQETPNEPRRLLAIEKLLAETPYTNFEIAHTKTTRNEAYNERNLVVVSRYPVEDVQQYRNTLLNAPLYKKVTAIPTEDEADPVRVERPVFYVKLRLDQDSVLHVINLHLKSRRPSNIKGQNDDPRWEWESAAGWAEGYFLSSLKRMSQALETRILVDQLFDADPAAKIIVCGDFNAHPNEVPVEAIAGRVENTGNADLLGRVLIPCEATIPEPSRFTYIHQGQKRLLDHMLISRELLRNYRGAEIHNETLHDEGVAFAFETKFPESDHAPFVAEFEM